MQKQRNELRRLIVENAATLGFEVEIRRDATEYRPYNRADSCRACGEKEWQIIGGICGSTVMFCSECGMREHMQD